MKIYISVDMEGAPGICHTRQEGDDTLRFRKAQQQQVEWVIEGIKNSDRNSEIVEITVADAHGYGRNISYDITDLDERISLISGGNRPQYMMSGLDETYDMVFFVGYHAGAGEEMGNMSHTMNGRTFYNVLVNDRYMNEAMLNAAYAGYYNVPVTLIIGDSGLKKQLQEVKDFPQMEYVVTKEALSWMSAKFKSKGTVKKEIIEAVKKVLGNYEFPRYQIEKEYDLKIDFTFLPMADTVSQLPGVKRNGRSIQMSFEDYKELYDAVGLLSNITIGNYPFDL